MEYFSSDKPYPRGEICMKGPNVFHGYYKREDKNAEAFDEQGWFRSGDVGVLYPNGSIRVVDRSKNIFKLSQGEYIAPEKLENIFVTSPYVAQSMVYGDSLKNCCVAIVVPDPDFAQRWGKENGKTDMADILADATFKKEVYDDMIRLATENKCSSLEKPKEILLTGEAFSIENEILTPTFKLKRNIGRAVYKAQIDEMYELLAKRGL